MAADVRCSYGTRFFHKGCYKRWQEKRAFQCAYPLSSGTASAVQATRIDY
jgi:hypothetical protein